MEKIVHCEVQIDRCNKTLPNDLNWKEIGIGCLRFRVTIYCKDES